MKMPTMGFGTAKIYEAGPFYTAIVDAGYRHIDTAKIYRNEEAVGEDLARVFKEHGDKIKREDLFITTKIWHDEYADPEAAIRESLRKLQLDYVDLYLIHWPVGFFHGKVPMHVLWAKLEKLVELGLTKAIGVSNFNVQLLADCLSYAKIKPQVNQVELNPLCVQEDLVAFMKSVNVVPVAFSPVSNPGVSTTGKDL